MQNLNSDKVFSGFRLGLLIGGLIALFRAPRIPLFRRGDSESSTARALMKRVGAVDPIARSIEEGKEAARLRREELEKRI